MSLNQHKITIMFTRTSFLAHVNGFIVPPNPQKNSIFQMEISIYEKVNFHSTGISLSFSAGYYWFQPHGDMFFSAISFKPADRSGGNLDTSGFSMLPT